MNQCMFSGFPGFKNFAFRMLMVFFLVNIDLMVRAQPAGGTTGIEGPPNVRTLSVKTISGEVIDVKVPNDIRPGDHITGTVLTKTQSSTLEGAVVDVENNKTSIKDKLFKFLVPAGVTSIPFLLRDNKGNSIANILIPLNVPDIPIPGDSIKIPPDQIEMPKPHSPGNFVPMKYCQPGQPLTINGNFDGNASNTSVSFGRTPVEIIAESPRGCFVAVPDNLQAGQTTIEIKEGEISSSRKIQVITINLSADKRVVQKGTKATITATVSGLENISIDENNFKVELTNHSPGVIQFREGSGNTLVKGIESNKIKNGVFSFTTDIRGISAGSYIIYADVRSIFGFTCWDFYQMAIKASIAQEKECYKDCDKNSKRTSSIVCYLTCMGDARLREQDYFQKYLDCLGK